MSEQTQLVERTPTPKRELPTTTTDCVQAAKYALGWDPVPFVFPSTHAECYVDEILRSTRRAIEAVLGVERAFARGELPVTKDTLRQRLKPDGTQTTLTEVSR
jgi:hypothetical protein